MDYGSHEQLAKPADFAAAFDRLVAADAAHPVLYAPDGRVSREALQRASTSIADDLRASIPPSGEGAVALAASNSPGFLAALLGIWRLNRAVLLVDADLPHDRAIDTATGLGAAILLRARHDWPLATGDFDPIPLRPESTPTLGSTAVIKLTSGSTGAPRGIALSPAAVAADTLAIEAAMGIGDGDRVLAAVPMSFSYGFGSLAVPALLRGRKLVLTEPGRPLAIMSAAREHEATVLPTVPVFLQALLKRDPSWSLPPSLRLILSAGAPLSPAVARHFLDRFGQPVHVFYGASECGGICYDRTGDAAIRGTVGTPVPGVDLDLGDGVVTVRSPAVARAYLSAAAGSAGAGFDSGEPANAVGPHLRDGEFQTGDEATWIDSELQLLGRRGGLINIGGHKINPRELEQVIAELPGVDGVHVTATPPTPERPPICCAVVESQAVTRQMIHNWCLQQLPAFKLPRRILVVNALPRSARGKVQAEAVRRLAIAAESRDA